MKIIVLYEGMLQVGLAAANRTIAYSAGLKRAGMEVEIWSPFGLVQKNIANISKTSHQLGVKYQILSFLNKHPKDSNPFLIAGILMLGAKYYGYLKLLYLLRFKKQKYDAVLVYEFGITYSKWIRKATTHKLLVYEVCEIPFFDERNDKKRLESRRKRELQNYCNADGFIAISHSLEQYLLDIIGSSKNRIIKIPVLTTSANSLELVHQMPHGAWEQPYFVHTGTLTQVKDGFLSIVEALGKLNSEVNHQVHLYCTGTKANSPIEKEIDRLIEHYKLYDYIHFTGYLSHDQLHALVTNASGAIIYKVYNEQNQYCFPTKLADYMMIGVPVIVTDIGEMKYFIQDGINGIVVQEGDLHQLVTNMKKLLNDDKFRLRLKKSAKETALNHFDYVKNGGKLASFFHKLKNIE